MNRTTIRPSTIRLWFQSFLSLYSVLASYSPVGTTAISLRNTMRKTPSTAIQARNTTPPMW